MFSLMCEKQTELVFFREFCRPAVLLEKVSHDYVGKSAMCSGAHWNEIGDLEKRRSF